MKRNNFVHEELYLNIPDFLKYVLCNFNICLADACFKLFVSTDSTSSHEFASQFGLAFFYTRKTLKSYREDRVPCKCLLNAPVTAQRQHERQQ